MMNTKIQLTEFCAGFFLFMIKAFRCGFSGDAKRFRVIFSFSMSYILCEIMNYQRMFSTHLTSLCCAGLLDRTMRCLVELAIKLNMSLSKIANYPICGRIERMEREKNCGTIHRFN